MRHGMCFNTASKGVKVMVIIIIIIIITIILRMTTAQGPAATARDSRLHARAFTPHGGIKGKAPAQ